VPFVLAPGLNPWWPGLVGPLLWLIAFVFTSVARFSANPSVAIDAPARRSGSPSIPEDRSIPIWLVAEPFNHEVDEYPHLRR
jgi:hypothetical protein